MQRFNVPHDFRIESIITLYARWIREGRLRPSSAWNTRGIKFTVQDPCQLVRKGFGDAAADDLRYTLAACVGAENMIDMQPNRSANYCCGGGGGYLQSGQPEARRAYGRIKHEQILSTGARYVVTPCHNCHSQIHDLTQHYKGGYHALHLWTLLALALGVLGENERTYWLEKE